MISSETRYTNQVFNLLQMAASQIVSSEFFDCVFKDCSFAETEFIKCRFVDCTFQKCDLGLVQMPECSFSGTVFEHSKCIGINWAQADWPTPRLGKPIRFKACAISHSTFIGLNLEGIQIVDSIAPDVDFREANLSPADFSGTDLSESLFNQTNLSQADLSRARNYLIDPAKNELKGARFSLPEAMSLLYNMDIELTDREL